MKKTTLLLLIAFWLIVPFGFLAQTTLAGDSGCQSGRAVHKYNTYSQGRSAEIAEQQEQFQAAQIRNGENQPPTAGGSIGGDSESRSLISYFASVFFLLGGIWLLVSLARERWMKRYAPKSARLAKVWNFALKPSFALSTFAVLFAAVVIGSVLTSPSVTSANPAVVTNKPVFKSAQQIGGSGLTQIGAPVFDAAGNRYVRGGFTGTLTIGAATLTATNDFDLFVAKYDANGNAIWARQASGAMSGVTATQANEGATALAVDGSGNVYLGGSFVKTLTLQGGANSITLNDNGAAGINYESFVAKYDGSGDLLWARGGNTNSPKNAGNLETGQNGINRIIFDAGGNPYIAGFVSGTRFLGDTITNQGQSDIMLAKLNPADGGTIWKKIVGGTTDDNALDLKSDTSGNLYVIGNFGSPSITFPTVPATTFTNPDGSGSFEDSTNTFVAKFDANGVNLWVKVLDSSETVGGSQIAVSGAGEVFLTGYFFDSVTLGAFTLTETEGSGEDEDALGGYVAKMNQNGDFVWAKQFGGVGVALALDGAGRIYIAGTFWDGGAFGSGTPNAETLASFGGNDLFVARYDANGNFDFAKAIAGSGADGEGGVAVGNPSAADGATENSYNPLGLAYNPATGTMFVSGDFSGTLSLDCLTLQTPGTRLHSYIAELSQDAEAVNCRIWNGLDPDDNNWDSPANWNGGIVPTDNNSVYVPYTGNDFDPPTFNPAMNIPLNNVTVADDRILTLEKPLTVNGRLDLLGGYVDAESFPLLLGAAAQAFSINDGLVLGRVQKQFAAGAGAFTFPVGTAAADLSPEFSPVTLSNINGAGSFSVAANKGAYPNTATGLPANRAARWWNLTNGGLTQANVTFQYIDGDITAGMESDYRAYRIPAGGGAAMLVGSSINTTMKTVFALNVTQFSDWTLAQAAPTAASATVGGRVTTANGRGIAQARVTITDAAGNIRGAITNAFGYYRFENVAAGETYIFNAAHKRFEFVQATQTHAVSGDRDDINFIAAY